jgi:RNase P subunit RPR2
MTITALEPLVSASPVKRDKEDQLREYCRKLFRAFREVFSAVSVTERYIFWMEQKNGKTIIRLVKNIGRKSKTDDTLVGITLDDISAVKIIIGNFASGCRLSTIRWELYADFDLSVLLDMGRFDSFDLFEGLDREKALFLVRQGVSPSGSWDFDAIIEMHQCPNCRQIFDRTSILYRPLITCESCGKEPSFAQHREIIRHLLRDFGCALEKLGQPHHIRNSDGQFPLQYYLDPVANSVVYWAIVVMLAKNKTLRDFQEILEGQYQLFKDLYSRSLFQLMMVDERMHIQKYFRQCIKQVGEGDGILLVLSLRRLGEAIMYPDNHPVPRESWWLRDLDVRMAQYAIPTIINKIILNHKTIKITERKIKK